MPEAHATRSWWDDVQHLRPDADERRSPDRRAAGDPTGASEPRSADRRPIADRRGAAEARGAAERRAPAAPRRRSGPSAEPRLSRAHAAGFADALDIDGAFGTPSRRFAREEQVFVIRRGGQVEVADLIDADEEAEVDAFAVDAVAEAPAAVDVSVAYAEELAAIQPPENWDVDEDGRRTVRITGRPLEHKPATRRLREIERRPRRNALERATSRPDRIAMYAVLLGILLVIIAAASSSAHPV